MKTALEVLQTTFGFEHFREPQQAIVEAIISGEDAFVLMPTGGGKSLCYQIPALVRPGCGIVISPLIALMQDQVDALKQVGIAAAFLNSSQSYDEQQQVQQSLQQGHLQLLYIAPERLILPATISMLKLSLIHI